jgi:peroxiredoxin family protein
LHTHFGSGTTLLSNGINVLLFLTFWRLAAFHLSRSSNPTVKAVAGAMFAQAG